MTASVTGECEALTNDFLLACDSILWELRSKGAVREADFDALLDKMSALAAFYQGKSLVAKELAAVLFDMSTALYSSTPKYSDLFDKFCDKARDILN